MVLILFGILLDSYRDCINGAGCVMNDIQRVWTSIERMATMAPAWIEDNTFRELSIALLDLRDRIEVTNEALRRFHDQYTNSD